MRKQDENKKNQAVVPLIAVRIEKGKAEKTDFAFRQPFRIGRDESCEIQVSDRKVSRFHAEIWFTGGDWWVLDLQSLHGIFLDGEKVERAPLKEDAKIELGKDGPVLSLTMGESSESKIGQIDQFSLTHFKDYYFADSGDEAIGERTMMIRRAFKQVQKRQKRKYAGIIAVVVCLFLAAGTYAVLKHMEVRKQILLAQDIFYAMKSLELEFSGYLNTARLSQDDQSIKNVIQYRARRKEMEKNYDQFLKTLEVYEKKMSDEERIILRIARTFGECEINIPAGFIDEVLTYINKWKSTNRLKEAISRARINGYITPITEIMLLHDLPPQFFYLALQESNFQLNACGPKTKYGIAKGMWQFIPSTAAYYGLRTGPLVNLRRSDPRDERHHFGKSTLAAAKYLRDIYDTEAQASGLLVIASYNWGERRVIELIQRMPENPRERNFWRLLAQYKNEIPKETYDYVFRIISAAVIGENPRLFGFDFDNPLAHIEKQVSFLPELPSALNAIRVSSQFVSQTYGLGPM
jgi:membrane-bound lytic murein transglycosylase D